MRKATLLVIALMAIGCGSRPPGPVTTVRPAPADPWTITNNDPKADTPALLWNGLIGIRFGHGKGRVFDISAYEKDGEEKIQPLPSPLDFTISSQGSDISPAKGKDFKETLDMRTGEVVQTYTADLQNPLKVEIRTAIHPERKVYAQKLSFTPLSDTDIKISGSVVGEPQKVKDIVSGAPGKLTSTDAQPAWVGVANANVPIVFERVVTLDGKPVGPYEEVASASQKAWTKRWQTDIEIDGPVEDQQAVRSFLFYLRSAIHPDGKMSISPMGLSNDIYNGHVFWDADIWVFPALALIEPEKAKGIPEYRLARQGQAELNYQNWWERDGRPTATGKMEPMMMGGMLAPGCKFPWESSVSGKETVPGPSKFEDHITGSVAFSFDQAANLGLVPPAKAKGLLWRCSSFYKWRSTGPDNAKEIRDVVSPDENHNGDNDLYTNLLAQWCTNGGLWDTSRIDKATMSWYENLKFKLPKDDKTFLTYDNDPVRGYKQAAAILSIYPLQYPPAEAQAKAMMDRFADKVTKNGPAMTDSIHAIIWARLGQAEKAYEEWHESWQPFVRQPFLLFSEKRSSSRTYFTTGAAGSLQTVLYGFAGLRIDDKKAPGVQWSMPLKNGKILSIAPHLPKAWKRLTLKNLVILGKRYTFEIANDKVKVIS